MALVGGLLAVAWLPSAGPLAGQEAPSGAAALVERALDLMGGQETLRSVERVRFDMMTQWQRTDFREVPWSDRPSFEPHVDVRDYTIPAWRNTRDFGARKMVNVVRDSVAVTDLGQGFQPLSVAYVDEREELFTYTPDRLVLRLRDAPDLALVGDTLIGGEPHRVVSATLGDVPATVAFHRGTGLPTMLRFRAGHPNDFGLVPWGEMRVEVWYSNWRSFGEISIPTQWDIQRVGRPYKRMTVRSATFDPDFAADSFAVADDVRRRYLETRGPMHDLEVDSVSSPAPGLLALHRFGFPTGAVRVGDRWILLEAGHMPLNLTRGRDALAARGMGELEGAVLVAARAGNGGVAGLVDEGVPVYAAPAAEPFIDVMLGNRGLTPRGVEVVSGGRWLGSGEERLRLEPVDLPDVPGSLLIYVPRLRWLYVPDAATSLDLRLAMDRARERGWEVEAVGTRRELWTEVPPGG